MKILVLSFYYYPDLSAGSFRSTAFVKALAGILPKGSTIEVITTLPNRYSSFTCEAPEYDVKESITIHRIKLPQHKSGFFDQAKAFVSYWKKANKLASDGNYDVIYATSSRLMTAVLGAWIASRRKTHLYLDIRDIFVDTINDVLPKKALVFIKPLFSILEKWAINKADKVNLVSEGFKEYFQSRYPSKNFSYFTNGIDDEFVVEKVNSNREYNDQPFKVVYAGNIGEGQGLHAIIPHLAKKMEGKLQFILIGDGGRKNVLQSALEEAGCKNVVICNPVGRSELVKAYRDADVLFLHLNDYEAFKKVLPSKLFEYAAMGKPIWAGVAGYAAKFVKNEITNAALFQPCNVEEAISVFSSLTIKDAPRKAFVDKYVRSNIMHAMAKDTISIIEV